MHNILRYQIAIIGLYALATTSVQASEIPAISKVSAVTMYADRAEITREGQATVAAGDHTIILEGLPDGFDTSSLRVSGKAGEAIKIGAVEVRSVPAAELTVAAEREKVAQLQAQRDERALLDAEIQALLLRQQFIERMATGGGYGCAMPMTLSSDADVSASRQPRHGNNQAEISPVMPHPNRCGGAGLPFGEWEKAWKLAESNMSDTRKEIIRRQVALRAMDKQISRIEREYQQIRTSQRAQNQVRINLNAKADTNFKFTVVYQTGGVMWQSVYDARLTADAGKLDMEQYGQAQQSTGEDWSDIALTFSTSRPDLGADMPVPSEWYIAFPQPSMLKNAPMSVQVGGSSVVDAMQTQSFDEEAAEPMPESIAAAPVSAISAVTEYSAEFRVPGLVSLKSASEPSRFFIAAQTMKADMEVHTVPALSPTAYLTAVVVNDGKAPLIPGQVAKYRDGTFVGNGSWDILRPGEKADLAFGIDDRVKVTYQKTIHKQNNPTLVYIGDVTAERQYRSVIKNLHQKAMRFVVIDRYPVSTDSDLKVTLSDKNTTKGYTEDREGKPGILRWQTDMQPQEEKTFDVGFEVAAPKKRQMPEF